MEIDYHNYKKYAEKIAEEKRLEQYVTKTLGTDAKNIPQKLFTVATLFLLFYSFTMSGLLGGLLFFQNEKMAEITTKINEQNHSLEEKSFGVTISRHVTH